MVGFRPGLAGLIDDSGPRADGRDGGCQHLGFAANCWLRFGLPANQPPKQGDTQLADDKSVWVFNLTVANVRWGSSFYRGERRGRPQRREAEAHRVG